MTYYIDKDFMRGLEYLFGIWGMREYVSYVGKGFNIVKNRFFPVLELKSHHHESLSIVCEEFGVPP